jgi:L-asparaginase II
MQAVPSLIAKEGAAGVMAAGLPDGRAVAYKVADGSDAARQAVVPAALRAAGIDVDAIAPDVLERLAVPVLGHGRPVGLLSPLEWTSCSS